MYFTGEGFDEMTEIRGAGSAELQDDGTIDIEFAYHPGDQATIEAEPVTSSTACSAQSLYPGGSQLHRQKEDCTERVRIAGRGRLVIEALPVGTLIPQADATMDWFSFMLLHAGVHSDH